MNRVCDNCGAVLHGDFCHACGQDNRPSVRGIGAILHDFFEEIADWDSRLVRTMLPLMFRPGFLSNEYVLGRRVRYVPPVRLYLVISLAFFLVLAVVTRVDPENVRFTINGQELASEQPDGVDLTGDQYDDVSIPFLDEAGKAEFRRRMARLSGNPEILFSQMRALAPTMMFLMLPVFALVLKIFYIYKPRYYIEHLVLALHTHAFMFLAFMLLFGMGALSGVLETRPLAPYTTGVLTWVSVALWVWIPVYLLLSQKRFYRQGWLLTPIKYFLTGVTYITMLGFFAAVLMLASVMTA